VCATLANNDALDFRPAHGTWLAFAVVNAKVILVTTAPIDPVDAGTVMFDAVLQGLADGLLERLGLLRRYMIRNHQRMQPGAVQCLVGVDVPQTSQKALIE